MKNNFQINYQIYQMLKKNMRGEIFYFIQIIKFNILNIINIFQKLIRDINIKI